MNCLSVEGWTHCPKSCLGCRNSRKARCTYSSSMFKKSGSSSFKLPSHAGLLTINPGWGSKKQEMLLNISVKATTVVGSATFSGSMCCFKWSSIIAIFSFNDIPSPKFCQSRTRNSRVWNWALPPLLGLEPEPAPMDERAVSSCPPSPSLRRRAAVAMSMNTFKLSILSSWICMEMLYTCLLLMTAVRPKIVAECSLDIRLSNAPWVSIKRTAHFSPFTSRRNGFDHIQMPSVHLSMPPRQKNPGTSPLPSRRWGSFPTSQPGKPSTFSFASPSCCRYRKNTSSRNDFPVR
mmetsp:Transcript_72923/g.194615  ORF Transcript_72923/g.194615 Transcript_72923/m.194615 type:complete len:291 (+) Transcript_72923:941-1813(+)